MAVRTKTQLAGDIASKLTQQLGGDKITGAEVRSVMTDVVDSLQALGPAVRIIASADSNGPTLAEYNAASDVHDRAVIAIADDDRVCIVYHESIGTPPIVLLDGIREAVNTIGDVSVYGSDRRRIVATDQLGAQSQAFVQVVFP